ncbi:MAG: hypothetical protein P1U63_10165 [Coxiellaceae bacterium]|nr:hypothetical protein [Coxiellaceae bacterium]
MSRFFEINPLAPLLNEPEKMRAWRLEDIASLEIVPSDFVPIAKDFKSIIDPKNLGPNPLSQYAAEPLFAPIYHNIQTLGVIPDNSTPAECIETLLLQTKQLRLLIQQELSIARATLRSLSETGRSEQPPAYYTQNKRMMPSAKLDFYTRLKAAIDMNLTEPMKTAIEVILSDSNVLSSPEYKEMPEDEESYSAASRGYTPPTP